MRKQVLMAVAALAAVGVLGMSQGRLGAQAPASGGAPAAGSAPQGAPAQPGAGRQGGARQGGGGGGARGGAAIPFEERTGFRAIFDGQTLDLSLLDWTHGPLPLRGGIAVTRVTGGDPVLWYQGDLDGVASFAFNPTAE